MTPDSLKAALTRILLAELSIEQGRAEECASALAAAVREWMRARIVEHAEAQGAELFYGSVARRLGL